MSEPQRHDEPGDDAVDGPVVLRLSDDGFAHAVAVYAQIRHAAAEAESDAIALGPAHRCGWRKSPFKDVLRRRQQKRALARYARLWLVTRALDSWYPTGEAQ